MRLLADRNARLGLSLFASALLAASVLSGCVAQEGGKAGPVAVPSGGSVVASPFSPAGIRLLPLSHFEVAADENTRILVFFELIDQWGDTVKGAGELELRIQPEPVGMEASRPDDQLVEWQIDLADLDRNAALYDPSTRAYRLALSDLPAWLEGIGRRDDGGDQGVELSAYFRTVASDGRLSVLRDRLSIRGLR